MRVAEGTQQLNFHGALAGIFELKGTRLADSADALARHSFFGRFVDHNAVAKHVLKFSGGVEAHQLAWRRKRAEGGRAAAREGGEI